MNGGLAGAAKALKSSAATVPRMFHPALRPLRRETKNFARNEKSTGATASKPAATPQSSLRRKGRLDNYQEPVCRTRGILWVVTDAGINRYDRKTDKWKLVECADPKEIVCSNALAVSASGGILWVGTRRSGEWDGKKWGFSKEETFLPGNRVQSLAAVSGETVGSERTKTCKLQQVKENNPAKPEKK